MSSLQDTIAGLSEGTKAFLSRSKGLLINNEFKNAASGKTFAMIDAVSEETISVVPEGDAIDIDRAVDAATTAFKENSEWRNMTPYQRQQLMLKLADLMEAHAAELAEIEALDVGKSVIFARIIDVDSTIEYLRYMAGWATKIEGKTLNVSLQSPPGLGMQFHAFTLREPIGVCGGIIPWNFPLAMAIWKLSPALAAGCCCVLKPAEQACLSVFRLGELIVEAGFPPGVINIVSGYGETAGRALVIHPAVHKIAFTGSTEVGKQIGKYCADAVKHVSLELGGKSPVIALNDANVDAVVAGAMQAIFFNSGQVCTAGSRLYVQRGKYEAVLQALATATQSIRIGSGFDPANTLGPMVSQAQQDRVLGFVAQGVEEGGTVLCGGSKITGKGYFMEPTIFCNVKQSDTIMQSEIFGPVVIVTPFDTIDEAVEMANNVTYGLAASIFSNDLSKVHRLIPRIQAGTVWVNTHNMIDPSMPFGGYKESGIGREMGIDAVHMYTETKSVLMNV